MRAIENNFTFCNLESIKDGYEQIHGYISLFVCIFGSLANIINICVLKTKQMRSPTNFILIGLAVADLLVMLEYIPFVIHRNLSTKRSFASHFTLNWAKFYVFHALFGQVVHFISCSLTLVLAVWRYVYISNPHGHCICANQRKTAIVILFTYMICPILCIPVLITLEVKKYPQTCNENGIMITKNERTLLDYSSLHNETIWVIRPNDPYRLGIWIYSVLLKLVPCIVLTFLFYKIISILMESKRRRCKLLSANMDLNGTNKSELTKYKETQSDRTTKMLLAVLFLFLVTEFPQAILGTSSAIYGEVFFQECYTPLGEIMDILALTNSAINFILYCSMSRQFRFTFHELLITKLLVHPCQKQRLNPNQAHEDNGVETKMSLV